MQHCPGLLLGSSSLSSGVKNIPAVTMRSEAMCLVLSIAMVFPSMSFISPPAAALKSKTTCSSGLTRFKSTTTTGWPCLRQGNQLCRSSLKKLCGTSTRVAFRAVDGQGTSRAMGGIDQSVRASTRKGGVFVTWAAEDGEAQGLPDEVAGAVATAVPEEGKLPFFLDPNTRGGAVVVPVLSLLVPLGAYGGLTAIGVDSSKAGAWVGVGYTLIGLIAWIGSYFFRVATKNMTYAVQLKNYEQAVIEKRFSELEDDEKDALLDEVNDS